MRPTITAFSSSPDGGKGQARDMRVRWALEEVAQPYDVRLLTSDEMKELPHLTLHPFGQIPTYEEGDLRLFESGSIVLHIAQQHAGLLPADAHARASAITWMFAALNTIEPPLVALEAFTLLEREKPWYAQRLPLVQAHARTRLAQLSKRLGQGPWLDSDFTAGDLMLAAVLFRTMDDGLIALYPNLLTYVHRAQARPAFQRAYAAQEAVFENQLMQR